MVQNRKINSQRLKTLLIENGFRSQKELAERIGMDVGTLSRWKTGKIRNIRSDKLARLCEALRTTPIELCADGSPHEVASLGDTARRDQITIMIDTGCRNALAMVARRYNVTRQQIVEIAPLLFAIAAEQSLADRRDRAEGRHKFVSPHLRRSLRGPFDEDDHKVFDAEQRLIDKRDLFTVPVNGWDEQHHENSPFAHFLSEKLSAVNMPKVEGVTWDEGDSPRYMIGIAELVDLLGRDNDACGPVLRGEVALAEMPGEIRKATPEIRAAWVKQKADLNDGELRAAAEDLKIPSIDRLVSEWLSAIEVAEHDF